MGGKPLTAMNILACPPEKEMDRWIVRQVVEGGLEKIKESGTLLIGGHSIEDNELKYGLSVTGVVHPDKVLTNGGVQAGDLLLLTKPVGTGILSTAVKGGLSDSDAEQLLVDTMAALNREAAEIMTSDGLVVHGCTDVTGFGLIGHLHEMASASGVAMELDSGRVPLVAGALENAAMGIIPAGAHTNRNYFRQWVDCRLPDNDPLEMILYDPQTSGGLLIAAPADSVEFIKNRLQQEGYSLACSVVARVVEGEAGHLRVV
jgi:selenide,water dikinase